MVNGTFLTKKRKERPWIDNHAPFAQLCIFTCECRPRVCLKNANRPDNRHASWVQSTFSSVYIQKIWKGENIFYYATEKAKKLRQFVQGNQRTQVA